MQPLKRTGNSKCTFWNKLQDLFLREKARCKTASIIYYHLSEKEHVIYISPEERTKY